MQLSAANGTKKTIEDLEKAAKALNDPDTYDKNSVWKQVRDHLDVIFSESLTLPENFDDQIADEVTAVITEGNYEVTKQTVLESMLWCYMVKMQ